MANRIVFDISSTLKGLILSTPPRARLQPENSERMTADLLFLLRCFLMVTNSKGGKH